MNVSGDDQHGAVGLPLRLPLTVVVVDSAYHALRDVPVDWTVTYGGGSVSAVSATTDWRGYAQAIWTLGSEVGTQYVRARVGPSASSRDISRDFTATVTVGSVSLDVNRPATWADDTLTIQVGATDSVGSVITGAIPWGPPRHTGPGR